MRFRPGFLVLPLLLAACAQNEDGAIDVAVIGEASDLVATGNRLAPAGELIRSATAQGLVRLDEMGEIVPGLAERWIVTDDGLSYIFRIRELDLPGGERLTARAAQRSLSRTIAGLSGTSLGLDLAQVRDVRAMTGRVIEIRLKSAMPGFLQLLAQPELGITAGDEPTGPMRLVRSARGAALLAALPPEARGLPTQPDWRDELLSVRLVTGTAASLTRRFSQGDFAVLLGGTLATLPLADTGPLSRGTVRMDATLGLFGLDVLREDGFLATSENREALALALDRAALIQPFNLAGWQATTRVVAPGMAGDPGLVGERWQGMDLAARRALAGARVARWRSANEGTGPQLRLRLPQGPGANRLFAGLAEQYATIGITLLRVQGEARADLALRDRVARYAGAAWFLNQFACRTSAAICSEDVDLLVQLAVAARDPSEQAGYLADAENAFAATNAYIPIGAPIRWSLVRSGVEGFAENQWAVHPLFPLTRAPM